MNTRKRCLCVIVIATLMLVSIVGQGAEVGTMKRDVTWFLRALRSTDTLPVLENSHTAMSSTWDRSGLNGDGLDFKRLEGKTNILLDVDGPGCLHRIFTGVLNDTLKGTRIQIYLDQEEQPIFDLPVLEFYDDKGDGPFPYPLVSHKSYPGILMPIPFARHIKVQLVNDEAGEADWSLGRWGNYWQLTYSRYAESVQVESLKWPLPSDQEEELQRTCQAWLDAEKQPPTSPLEENHRAAASLAPGDNLELTLAGAGTIQTLRIKLSPDTAEALYDTRLRIYWDGSANASVDVPVGRFWGNTHYGYGRDMSSPFAVERYNTREPVAFNTNYSGLLMSVTSTGASCRFPMPFAQGARVVLANESEDITVEAELALAVEIQAKAPDDCGRFHATYRQSRIYCEEVPKFGPSNIAGHVVLDRRCRGKYVGVMLHINWPFRQWWGEGDWLIWTDENAWPPSYHGTGSEEYFNAGWCQFDRKALSGFVGLRPGHPTVYSFHINDAFQFEQCVRVVEEQYPYNTSLTEQVKNMQRDQMEQSGKPSDIENLGWDSVAFWYALPAQAAGSF